MKAHVGILHGVAENSTWHYPRATFTQRTDARFDSWHLNRDHACVVPPDVFTMFLVKRILFRPLIWIMAHAVEWQRRELIGTCGIYVHLFAESIAVQQEGSLPSAGKRRQRAGVERKADLVAGPADDKHIVSIQEQFAHIAFACVASAQDFPRRCKRDPLVVVTNHLA